MYSPQCTCTFLAVILFYGCSNNDRQGFHKDHNSIIPEQSSVIQYKEIAIRLHQVVQCQYPAHDPVYLQKKSSKLLVMDISVKCTSNITAADKIFITPTGASIWDSRGNKYEVSPQVIAMAQNSHCIKGDDIESYNVIWNASLKTGETRRAFVLGFELPEDAVPTRLCWNKSWEERHLFFELGETNALKVGGTHL